jgi:hypothetical protein
LAQPPDISETFVREVEENLRRDQLRDFSTKYAGWMIAALLLFLAGAGGWIYWQDYRARQSEKAVEELAKVFADSTKPGAVNLTQRLDALSRTRTRRSGRRRCLLPLPRRFKAATPSPRASSI